MSSALVVLLGHFALLGIVFLRGTWKLPVSSPEAAMTLELAPLPMAPRRPPTQIPAGPPRLEAHPGPQGRATRELKVATAQLAAAKPVFELPPEVKVAEPEVTLPKEDAAVAKAERSKLPPAVTTTALPTPRSPQSKELRAQAPGAAANAPSNAEQTWEAKIMARLERYKRYPGSAQRRRETGIAYLHFKMDRKGRVLDARIDRSAGYSLLDDEVLDLVHRAAPLPAPPEQVPGDPLELVVPVEFFLKKP